MEETSQSPPPDYSFMKKHLLFIQVSQVLNFLGYKDLGYEVIR
jgi:hypothetical protein